MKEESFEEELLNLKKKLEENSEDIDEEINEIVNRNFWDLI
jgi:hypothetical protein